MPNLVSQDPLVWIDCEMTGLDLEKDSIMEIACYITDAQLNLLDPEGLEIVIHHDKARLDQMDAWCTKHHGESGLTNECISSTTTAEEAAGSLLSYVQKYIPEPRCGLLAGNSVHADKAFLVKPPYDRVMKHLHYRILDVSTFKEAARRWAPGVLKEAPKKKNLHEARADILESIEEAKYYKSTFFSSKDNE